MTDTDDQPDDRTTTPGKPPTPNPIVFLFAAAFVVAMFVNLLSRGSDTLTMFLASAALLTIGVDVGKMIGRR